jgi:alkylation response protein AidB-like acyl-CoA dehydrogenase
MSEALVRERVDRLVAERDPAATDPHQFWGAQYDLGLAWVHFPEGLGGLGLDPKLQAVVDDRLQRAEAPSNRDVNFMGIGMAAPTIIEFGSDDHRQRFLRPAFTCDEIWCQMFSEPGAGSDLAALSTRAERDGDEWVVNGQKVWTTQAHVARWGLLLTRTDPDARKHEGLTYFIVDMHAPGVEVRPLRQMTGDAEFNEVYFTDVRVPDERRLGPVGAGWRVALTTLMNERVALGGLAKEQRGQGLIRHAVRVGAARARQDRIARDRLARLWIEAEVIRLTTLRAQSLRQQGTPGPEGAILKLAVSEFQRRVFEGCVDLAGAAGMLISDYEFRRPEVMGAGALGDGDDIDVVKAFLLCRGSTIGGGTTEIGRNILGERVLGLPGEPRVDKDLPWSKVPRS